VEGAIPSYQERQSIEQLKDSVTRLMN